MWLSGVRGGVADEVNEVERGGGRHGWIRQGLGDHC